MLLIKLLRANQWIKNFVIFVPLFFSINWQLNDFIDLIGVFLAFSLICSSVYIFNDLIDIENDQKHPTKKYRPIAFGLITKHRAIVIIFLLIFFSFFILYLFEKIFLIKIITFYLFLNFLYSFFLKKIKYIDIFILSSFYILRLYLGSFALNIEISKWLLIYSIFLFLSLSILKRLNEVLKYKDAKIFGRNYSYKDVTFLKLNFNVLSILSILIFFIYSFSSHSDFLYSNNIYLQLITIFMLLTIFQINKDLFLNKINDDPTIYVITNFKIIIYIIICLLLILLSIFNVI